MVFKDSASYTEQLFSGILWSQTLFCSLELIVHTERETWHVLHMISQVHTNTILITLFLVSLSGSPAGIHTLKIHFSNSTHVSTVTIQFSPHGLVGHYLVAAEFGWT